VCLDDGKKMKMLKRHLMTHHSMSPDEYRAKWSLPADYPMVAPNYAEQRRTLAMKIGLGRKPGKRNKRK
jgi:predicted transcriptional regulator